MKDAKYKYLALAIIITVSILAISLTLAVNGLLEAVMTAFFIVLLLFVTKQAWAPENYGNTRVRMYSLFIILSLSAPLSIWIFLFENLIEKLQIEFLSDVLKQETDAYIFYLIFALIGILIVNYFMRDNTGMKVHPKSLVKEFPEEPSFNQRLLNFRTFLLSGYLDKIDITSNWSSDRFTPIEARVEVKKGKPSKQIVDLISAIKKNNSAKIFLVLGDPGSGKSVALRKLCRDLLAETEKTGKIPIYVNLKEWVVSRKWTKEHPPTASELHQFILDSFRDKNISVTKFLDKYYYSLVETGRIFLILDSFDEIPMVLDENESSWIIDKLSEVIYNTIAQTDESRGVLASRMFRRPSRKFNADVVLRIRPFPVRSISENLKKSSLNVNEALLAELFSERPDLVTAIKTPFINELLINFIEDNGSGLPKNQAELFLSYFTNRFQESNNLKINLAVSEEEATTFCKNVAMTMFNSKSYGLEIPVEILEREINLEKSKIRQIINLLTFIKVGRLSEGQENNFSFVHRRFNEFFVAQHLLENPQLVNFEHIPKDSRWRDALVLYCEIAPEAEAKRIANRCWLEIQKLHKIELYDEHYLRSIHCLRFLVEAYRARKNCLIEFKDQLSLLVQEKLYFGSLYYYKDLLDLKSSIPGTTFNTNILEKKLISESIGLLDPSDINLVVPDVLRIGNDWISETAINSCRHLPKLSEDVIQSLKEFTTTLGDWKLMRDYKDLLFQFKLSTSFTEVYLHLKKRIWKLSFFLLGVLLSFLINPLLGLTACMLFWLLKREWYQRIYHQALERIGFILTFFFKGYTFLFQLLIFLLIPLANLIIDTTESMSDNSIIHTNPGNIPDNNTLSQIRENADNFEEGASNLINQVLSAPLQSFSDLIELTTFITSSWVYFLGLILVLPISYEKQIKNVGSVKTIFKILKNLAIIILLVAFVVFLRVISEYNDVVSILMNSIFGLIAILNLLVLLVGFGWLVWNSVVFLRKYLSDLKIMRQVKSKVAARKLLRSTIEEYFLKFQTSQMRIKYVKYLDNPKFTVSGNWKNKTLPYIHNDRASTLLAQLEEKWLGLER